MRMQKLEEFKERAIKNTRKEHARVKSQTHDHFDGDKWKYVKQLIFWHIAKKGQTDEELQSQATVPNESAAKFEEAKKPIIEDPTEFNKRNYKSISSPNKERRSEAFITKKKDTTLNRDVFVLLKDLDLDPNMLSNHQSIRLHDSLQVIEKIRDS